MPWLAVDKDGTEWIFNYEVERHLGQATDKSRQLISFKDVDEKRCDFWTMKNTFGYNFPKLGVFPNKIKLPYGSICKLIGSTLTWADEPVQFN